ncbi:hypothetical protein [Brachybacterium sp. NPDC056505]|uniref:hypothetical protein n=1 Tax=Brachybacterium sp. NPDC056505 TaxID=3345843 RepID=UPI00366C832C
MPAHRTRTRTVDCDCTTFQRHHGTVHTYTLHRCGCVPCRQAAVRDARERRTASRTIPIGPTLDRLELLAQRGVTLRQIALYTGRAYPTLVGLHRPSAQRVGRDLAAEVASIPIPPEKPYRECAAVGCHRIHRARGLCQMHLQRLERRAASAQRAQRAAA